MGEIRPLAEYIGELKDEGLDKRVVTIEGTEYFVGDDGILFDPKHLLELSRVVMTTPIEGQTLQSVVDFYVKESGFDSADTFVHVSAPGVVSINKLALFADGERDRLLSAAYGGVKHHFGEWLKVDEFTVWLMSCFEESEGQKGLLAQIAKGMKFETARQVHDDGVSVQYKQSQGAAGLEWSENFSPFVTLRPRRAFPEINQPECLCVFRTHGKEGDDPVLRLIEADGGNWKHLAVSAIADWLKVRIEGVSIIN